MEEERLQKILARCAGVSRRRAEELIAAGRVRVNGNTAQLGEQADAEEDVIELDGTRVKTRQEPQPVYLMLCKPRGFVTTMHDEKGRRSVAELVADLPERVYPVGRLDCNSEGLLLLTNDGALAHDLLSPKKHVDKTYLVKPEKPLSAEDIHRLENGLDIGDEKPTAPSKARLTENGDLLLTIHEGRFHQVKRMLQAVDNQVLTLERVSFGPLSLDFSLQRGEYRALTEEEIEVLSGSGKKS